MVPKTLRFSLAAAASAALLAGGATAYAQVGKKKAGDQRVAAALDAAELKYEVDEDGDFKLSYQLPDDRTQVVYINSNTETLGTLEIRELWSIALDSEEALDAETANDLLIDSGKKKIGAWRVETNEEDDRHIAVFAAQIDAGADGATLSQIIEAVVSVADAKENELTEEDNF